MTLGIMAMNVTGLVQAAGRSLVWDYLAARGAAERLHSGRHGPQRHPRVRMVAGRLVVYERGRPVRALDPLLVSLFATWDP